MAGEHETETPDEEIEQDEDEDDEADDEEGLTDETDEGDGEEEEEEEEEEQETALPPAKPLPGVAVRHLRGLGHPLEPIIRVGKEGITRSLVEATRAALLRHELIKVRVLTEAPIDRHEAGKELALRTGAILAQVLGRTLLLYRRHPKKPRISLPAPSKKR
jgi:RNA-binding protein